MTEAAGEVLADFVKGLYQFIGCLLVIVAVLVLILGFVLWKVLA